MKNKNKMIYPQDTKLEPTMPQYFLQKSFRLLTGEESLWVPLIFIEGQFIEIPDHQHLGLRTPSQFSVEFSAAESNN